MKTVSRKFHPETVFISGRFFLQYLAQASYVINSEYGLYYAYETANLAFVLPVILPKRGGRFYQNSLADFTSQDHVHRPAH